jgi:hypothetical protein
MKRHCYFFRVLLVVLLRVCPSPAASALEETKDGTDRWTRENYERVLDLVFQDRCTAPTDARWVSCVRIIPAFKDEMEYSLSLGRRYDGTLLARVTRPKSQSVYVQLRELKKEHPHGSVNDLSKMIKVESQSVDQLRFPALVALANEFENIRFSPALSDEVMMDATEYRFCVRSFSGDSMALTLHGPGPAAPRQPQGLIQWAESAREVLTGAFK